MDILRQFEAFLIQQSTDFQIFFLLRPPDIDKKPRATYFALQETFHGHP